jgi:hypothetical protein
MEDRWEVDEMTAYAMNKVCIQAAADANLRRRMKVDLEGSLETMVPALSAEEKAAFVAGDAAELVRMGASRYLLMGAARSGLFGLDMPSFTEKLRVAYLADPEGRADISPVKYP